MSHDSNEPLQCLPLERWSELQGAFKKDWPRGVSGCSVLETQRQWVERGIHHNFKVYCPFGDVNNGMVAVNIKSGFYEVIIQCPSDDTKNLGVALRETKVIDWKQSLIVPYAPNNVFECIKKIVDEKDLKLRLGSPAETVMFDGHKLFDVKLLEGMTFDILTDDNLDLIDSTWPHRYPTSSSYFQLLITAKQGYGLYLNGTLITWVFINEAGNLLHLYTVEEHRKKGYAELLLKLISNVFIKDGKPVFAYCLTNNVNAYNLYMKTGFRKTEDVTWCYLNDDVNQL